MTLRDQCTDVADLVGFNTASGMRSHVTLEVLELKVDEHRGFNTASGMRSHVTTQLKKELTEQIKVSIPQAV